MQVNPTDIIDGHPTANADAGPLPNKSADAASTTIDNFDLKAGDALVAEGNLDGAHAAYLRHKAKCQEFAKRSNPQAAKQLYQVARRIGDLAFQYLLLGHFERALECSDEALAGNPNSVILDITRAHALMFLGRVEEAEAIYRRYHGRNMAHRYTCDGYIRGDFDRLREAGFSHALMDVVEGRMFGTDETDETDELSAETAEPVVEAIEPATDEDQSKLAIARLPVEVELGDQLRAEGKLEAARESYRRGFEISSARIAEDDADLQAQRDADLAVSRMGGLAFAFLLKRKAAPALETIEEAMSYRPSWVWLRLVYAHALMLNARITHAGNVHREYCNRTVETGGTWAESMREDFAALREAGFNLPIMEYFEQQYASKS